MLFRSDIEQESTNATIEMTPVTPMRNFNYQRKKGVIKTSKYCDSESPKKGLSQAFKNLAKDSNKTPFKSNYFVKHFGIPADNSYLRILSPKRHPGKNSKSQVGVEYISHALSTLASMRDDVVVYRPNTIEYVRKHADRKLLLLDLDETLVHCSDNLTLANKFDHQLDFIKDNGIMVPGLLNIRPHAQAFIESMSKVYEVVVFTASMKYYADRILDVLDPQRRFISKCFYRQTCSKTSSSRLVKDMSMFGGVPLNEILLVDNNLYCMWTHPINGVPILHFTHNKADRELIDLESFLIDLARQSDHTHTLRHHFKLDLLFDNCNLNYYVSQMSKR